MSATFNTDLVNLSDHMRLALGDTDVSNPVLQDETYNALVSAHGYVEGLAQAAQAILDLPDPGMYKAGSTDAEFDFTAWIANVRKVRDDCRAGLVHAPGGAYRVGMSVSQPAYRPDRGFREL